MLVEQHGGSTLGSVNFRKTFWRISEVWAHEETQNLEKCLFCLSPITLQFLAFFHWVVFDFFFCCVTVKTNGKFKRDTKWSFHTTGRHVETRRIKQTYLNCETVQLEFETKRPIVSLKTAFIQHNDSLRSTVWGISTLLFNLSRAQTLVLFIQNPEKTPWKVKVTQTSKYWKKQVNTTENKQRNCRQKNQIMFCILNTLG